MLREAEIYREQALIRTIFALFKATRENKPQRRKGRKEFLFYLLLCDLCVSAVKSYFCKHRDLYIDADSPPFALICVICELFRLT